jgi:hypothetical protein
VYSFDFTQTVNFALLWDIYEKSPDRNYFAAEARNHACYTVEINKVAEVSITLRYVTPLICWVCYFKVIPIKRSITDKVNILIGPYVQVLCYVILCLLVVMYWSFGGTWWLNHQGTWICSSSFLPFLILLALHPPPQDILLPVIDWVIHFKLCSYIYWPPIKILLV